MKLGYQALHGFLCSSTSVLGMVRDGLAKTLSSLSMPAYRQKKKSKQHLDSDTKLTVAYAGSSGGNVSTISEGCVRIVRGLRFPSPFNTSK